MGENHHRIQFSGQINPSVSGQRESSEYQEMWFGNLLHRAEKFLQRHQRPMVTVTYAQSVDGSIATRNSEQLQLSSHDSMVLTHRLRAGCDAILIGINTLLIDDP